MTVTVIDGAERCPACGRTMDRCIGHTLTGDPFGYGTLLRHGMGDHTTCEDNLPCTTLTPEDFRDLVHRMFGGGS